MHIDFMKIQMVFYYCICRVRRGKLLSEVSSPLVLHPFCLLRFYMTFYFIMKGFCLLLVQGFLGTINRFRPVMG